MKKPHSASSCHKFLQAAIVFNPSAAPLCRTSTCCLPAFTGELLHVTWKSSLINTTHISPSASYMTITVCLCQKQLRVAKAARGSHPLRKAANTFKLSGRPDLRLSWSPAALSGLGEILTAGLTSSNTDVSSAPSAPDSLTGFSCVKTALSSVAWGGFMANPTLVAIKVSA